MLTQEELAKLLQEAETELKKYPGVISVGWGYKKTGGEFTEAVGFRVVVEEKKPKSELKPEEILPSEFKGLPVDVMTIPRAELLQCGDLQYHSPLIGGITVSNQKLRPDNRPEVGTLGFFATINGQAARENIVLVSNNHVLMAVNAQVNDTVFQTEWIIQNGVAVVNFTPDRLHPVAKIHNQGLLNNHPFTFPGPGETQQPYGVDCATAKLDISISSWCGSNCGVSYKNEIRGLNVNGSNAIASVANIRPAQVQTGQPDYVVFKVGRTTDRTVGKVTAVIMPFRIPPNGPTLQNCIEIVATQNNCLGLREFADHGDSGAAIINASNQLVGILVGRDEGDPRRPIYACHIAPVLDLLHITPISAANPPVRPAGELFADAPGVLVGGVDHTAQLKQKLLSTERGREFFDLVLAHRLEVLDLVNQRRPVTVAWHRSKGPAFFAHLIQSARDPAHVVPREIEGVTREALIENMARAFAAHGSPELKALVEQYLGEALALADRFDRLHEVVEHVEEFELV